MKIFNKNINLHIRDTFELFLTNSRISKTLFRNNRSIIFNRANTRKLIRHYNGDEGHQANNATGNLGYGFIHYALILNIKPERILCIGSRKGFIPSICALACQENGKGTVDFVDAGYGPENPNHWSGIAWWKKVDPQIHFSVLDVNEYLTTFIMTTKEFAPKFKHKYQYIYIDGDHSYKGVKIDYNLFWPRLDKGGFMIFHDVTVKKTRDLGVFGVWKFWRELKNTNKITFFEPKHSGLGILQKL